MKKFSVLLVAILALMMLFVSCENEPEKRAATKKDGEIIGGLIMSAMVGDPVEKNTVEKNEDFALRQAMAEKGVGYLLCFCIYLQYNKISISNHLDLLNKNRAVHTLYFGGFRATAPSF